MSTLELSPTETVDPAELATDLPEVDLSALPAHIQAALQRAGWNSLKPVQLRTIPYLLDGEDVMIQARTGSGKTGAFLLPLLELLDFAADTCQVLVLVPTAHTLVVVQAGRRQSLST